MDDTDSEVELVAPAATVAVGGPSRKRPRMDLEADEDVIVVDDD